MGKLGNGWLSPQGDWYPCNSSHGTEVIALLFSRNNQELFKNRYSINFELYLKKIGWIKHCDRPWYYGWEISPFNRGITQAQINKIYELTGDVFENENLLWPYFVRSFF